MLGDGNEVRNSQPVQINGFKRSIGLSITCHVHRYSAHWTFIQKLCLYMQNNRTLSPKSLKWITCTSLLLHTCNNCETSSFPPVMRDVVSMFTSRITQPSVSLLFWPPTTHATSTLHPITCSLTCHKADPPFAEVGEDFYMHWSSVSPTDKLYTNTNG